jgi:hypothetical protein
MTKRNLLFISLYILLSICGSGNAASNNTSTFQMYNPHHWAPGTKYDFRLTGSSSDGSMSHTSQFTITKRSDSTFQGQPASQFDAFFSLASQHGPMTSHTINAYANINSNVVLGEVYDKVTCAVSNASITIPATIHDGDSGVHYHYNCSDKTSITSTWRANIDQVSGHLMYAYTSVATDASGNVYVTQTDTYYLNKNGLPQRIDMHVVMPGLTFDLSSN